MTCARGHARLRGCGANGQNAAKLKRQSAAVAASKGSQNNGGRQSSEDEGNYGVPAYLQSTIADGLCDDWADAIDQAEASAAKARSKAASSNGAVAVPTTDACPQRLWKRMCAEVSDEINQEPVLSSFLFTSILSHTSFAEALAFILSNRIADQTLLPTQLFSLFMSLEKSQPVLLECAVADLEAVYDRDPSCHKYAHALLYFKGYHALQLHRFAHELWRQDRKAMALSLQSRLSEVLAVDIHPAATIKKGILMDHGTGVVIGETAVIGNGVSIMQNVTLGGTGKEIGDRHPKVGDHVLIGCGASVLGNITIGVGAQIAAGSLVLKPVDPHTLVAGSPAKFVRTVCGNPAEDLQQGVMAPEGETAAAAAPRMTAAGAGVQPYSNEEGALLVDAERELFGGISPATSSADLDQDSDSPPPGHASAETSAETDFTTAQPSPQEPRSAAASASSARQNGGARRRQVAVSVASDSGAAVRDGTGMVSLEQWRGSLAEGAEADDQQTVGKPARAKTGGSDDSGEADSGQREQSAFESLEEGVPVDATNCDDEAVERWGEQMREPEFFI